MNDSNPSKPTKGKFKPLLLSALVLPGLGQLSQGKKALGFAIIASCILCLYIIFGEAIGEINAASQRILSSGSMDAFRVQEEAHNIILNLKTFKFLAALYSLVGLWLFSMINIFKPIADKTK